MKKILPLLVVLSLATLGACTPRSSLVEIGYEDSGNVKMVNLKISEETAIAIADAIFLQRYGEEFMERTISVVIDESLAVTAYNSEDYITILRYEEGVLGGGYSIVIRMSDGKVMRIYPG